MTDTQTEPASVELDATPRHADLIGTVRSQVGGYVKAASTTPALTLAAITLIGLAIRLYRLGDIPAEMWGDVVTHYQLALNVMQGHPYTDYEFGGDGPMLSYIVAGLASILGLSFTTLKLATVLIGTGTIIVTYFLARELFGSRYVGLLAAFFGAVSFWDVTFSRQAKPYILVPLLAALAVVFALQNRQVLAGVALGLGMYTQAAFWGVPFAFLVLPVALMVGAAWAVAFILNVVRDPSFLMGSSSYIGQKLHQHLSPVDMILRVLDNSLKNALSFFVRGDATFRHNIPYHPHLDPVSAALFLVGFGAILWRIDRDRDRRLFFWFLIPFLVIQIPSVVDLNPADSPNMGRMLGTVPWVFSAIAYAVALLTQRACRLLTGRVSRPQVVAGGLVGVMLLAVFAINQYNYFVVYPRTLPNGNTPFGLTIAQSIDASNPAGYSIVVGCCWADWGQPEPGAISDTLTEPRHLLFQDTLPNADAFLNSHLVSGTPVTVYLSPASRATMTSSPLPLGGIKEHMLRRNGWDVAWVVEGTKI